MLRSVFVCVSIGAILPAEAAPSVVSGRAISDLVAGAHVEIDAPLGNKIPILFTGDGTMSGTAPELAGYLGAPSDLGRWWVKGDELCSRWERWLDGRTECMRLSKDGNRIHWVNQDGRQGTAHIVSRAKPQLATTARPTPAERSATAAPAAPASTAPVPTAKTAATVQAAVIVAGARSPVPAASVLQSAAVALPATPRSDAAVRSKAPPQKSAAPSQPRRNADASGGPLFRVARVDAGDVLFVREGPSADHLALGALMPDAHDIRIIGACRSKWCQVTHREITGWVNRAFLEPAKRTPVPHGTRPAVVAAAARAVSPASPASAPRERHHRDAPDTARACLSNEARGLLKAIEVRFGPVELVSTCRSGATIAGTGGRPRQANRGAIDFKAGDRRAAIVAWLAANHRNGGTTTYGDKDHIHADIGPHFVALAARDRAPVQAASARDWSEDRMSLRSGRR